MIPVSKRLRYGPRIFKGFALLVALGVLAMVALLVSLRLEHRIAVTLPTPTGPLAVGRAIYDWTDDRSLEMLAPVPGTKRELLVWIWYPADPRQSSVIDDYLPSFARVAIERDLPALIGKFLTRDLAKVRGHSLRDSDISPRERTYPVVIMRAGASAEVANYSTLAEDLASQGYVVVGFDAPYRTNVVAFPDGRVITRRPENNPELCAEKTGEERARCAERILRAWTGDTAFVLDRLQQWNASGSGRFSGRLDLSHVGVFGHSFGGAMAAEFCHEDARCKAGIDIDGAPFGSVIQTGIDRPFMFLMSDHGHESDPEAGKIMANIQSIYLHLPADTRLLATIRGANHFLFSDDGALLKSHIVLRVLRIFGIVGIDGRRQLAITTYCVHGFFDAHLRDSHSQFVIPSPLYPEIRVTGVGGGINAR